MMTASEVGHELRKGKVRPLVRDEAEILIRLSFTPKFKFKEDEELPFGLKVIAKRLEACEIPASDAAKMFIFGLSDRAGTAVMLCAVIKSIYDEVLRQVELSDLVHAFPLGVPIEQEYHRVWDMQKVKHEEKVGGSDNWLDHAEAWILEKAPAGGVDA